MDYIPPTPAIVPMSSLDMDPLKKDFRNFMWKTWMTLFGNPPTNRMYEVGERLQHGPGRDIIMGFRGLSKSYITVDFGVWFLHCEPTEIVLTVSGSGDGAKGNATLAYGMINGFDWLAHLKPKGMLRQSAQAFDVMGSRMEKSESFAAMSLFGQITGRRASLIIPDDVETPNTSATENDRQQLDIRYKELGGAILKPGGLIKGLGTAQTEETLYVKLAQERGYGLYMIPAVYPRPSEDPKKDELRKYGSWLSPSIRDAVLKNPELAGLPTEPTRFTSADLEARLLEYGTTEFDRQFRLFLDAGQGNAKPLRMKDIPVIEIPKPVLAGVDPQGMVIEAQPLRVPGRWTWSPNPLTLIQTGISVDALSGDSHVYAPTDLGDWAEPETKVMIIDPSGKGTDETAWGILTQHLGRVGLVHLNARLEGFTDATLEAIAADAKLYGVHKIIIESNFGGGMFSSLLKPKLAEVNHACTILDETAGQVMKEQRIVDTLQPVISSHRLWIAAEVLRWDWKVEYPNVEQDKRRNYRLTYQLTRMAKVKNVVAHDDRVDMLAAGVKSFMGSLQRQLSDAAAQSRADYLIRQAEIMMETRQKQLNRIRYGQDTAPDRMKGLLKDLGGLVQSNFFKSRGKAA